MEKAWFQRLWSCDTPGAQQSVTGGDTIYYEVSEDEVDFTQPTYECGGKLYIIIDAGGQRA